jgi:hypothetical protein
LSSCRNPKPAGLRDVLPAAILRCKEEFHIKTLACLVAQKGKIILQQGGQQEEGIAESARRAIAGHFMAPMILDRMIRDSMVHEADSITPLLKAKQLIQVPADYYERIQDGKGAAAAVADVMADSMDGRLSRLIGRHSHPGDGYSPERLAARLGLGQGQGMQGLFQDLLRVSDHFDEIHPEYAFSNKAIYNVFPTWYTRGLSRFFGWRVLKFQGETVLWNQFAAGAATVLVIRFMDRGIFAAVSYATDDLPASMEPAGDDVLRSPMAVSLFEAVYKKDSEQGSPYHFIYLHDLLAHARWSAHAGMEARAAELYALQGRSMHDTLLVRYENKPVLAEIGYVSDNLRAVAPFTMQQAGWVQLFAGGQLAPPHDYEGESWQFDNVQLFINDHASDKDNSWLNTHLFQFNYGSDSARGTQAQFAIGDPADTSYLVEVGLRWNQLNPTRHVAGRKVLANILVGDCDLEEGQRKSVLSWAVGPTDNYADEKKYGRIVLADRPGTAGAGGTVGSAGSVQYAIRTQHPPRIDGKAEDCWDKACWCPVRLPYIGSVSGPDNAARFKALYDDSCLYLLFAVTDNCKNRYGLVTADKCWIEDVTTGLPVWKMNGSVMDGYPDFSERKRIFLPAGRFLLKYASDRGNSYEHWYGKPPANGIYGAVLYSAEN